jgi:hypothetical protein
MCSRYRPSVLIDSSGKSLSCNEAGMGIFNTTTFDACEIQLTGPRASIFSIVQMLGVFPVLTNGGVGFAFTRAIGVAGTTEDFMQDPLHQKWIGNLLMAVIRIQKFL